MRQPEPAETSLATALSGAGTAAEGPFTGRADAPLVT